MNIKFTTNLIVGLFLFFLLSSSCNSDNTTTSYGLPTNDAQIYSFSISAKHYKSTDSLLRAADSLRFLQVNKTKFAIDQTSGVIYNPDSMPYGTVLKNKVSVTTTYNPNGYSKVVIITPDSTKGYIWNSTDSVDFSKTPIRFEVTPLSGDEKLKKSYKIDLRIHKVDPDTLLWNKMQSYPSNIGESKTLLVARKDNKEEFVTYYLGEGEVVLYSAPKDNLSWKAETVSGLPMSVKIESISYLNKIFYAILDNGNTYKSNDGANWAKVKNYKTLSSVVGILPAVNRVDDQLLVILKDRGNLYFGKTKDMLSIEVVSSISLFPTNNELPSGFPLSGTSSYTNYTTDNNKRLLIVTGGLDKDNKEIERTWFIRNTSQGLDMALAAKSPYFKGEGLSTVVYNNSLYVLIDDQFYVSDNWGNNWAKAPNKQKLDPQYVSRSGQSLIVDGENNIWIFGGMSDSGFYKSDVWKGRLNKLIP